MRITGSDTVISGCLADSNQNAGCHIDPQQGYIDGLCANGFNEIRRPQVQGSKPWVGQAISLLSSDGILNDS